MRVRRRNEAVQPVGLVTMVVTRRRAMLILGTITAAFFVQGGVLACAVRNNHDLARQGKQAHDAICALKDDLRRRIDSAERFLQEHPASIPGIPPSVIRNSITNSKRSLTALRTLNCERGT